MSCPWGSIQNTEHFERGISFVSTASHGGLRISRKYADDHLSKLAIQFATSMDDNYLWYEEDCDYAIPMYELDYLWGVMFQHDKKNVTYNQRKSSLEDTVKYWNPIYAVKKGIITQSGENFCCKNWSAPYHHGTLDVDTMSCSVCHFPIK